jgi:hypothetical protein
VSFRGPRSGTFKKLRDQRPNRFKHRAPTFIIVSNREGAWLTLCDRGLAAIGSQHFETSVRELVSSTLRSNKAYKALF